jgi:hypothetical protein
MVWELEGPMPILKISKTLRLMGTFGTAREEEFYAAAVAGADDRIRAKLIHAQGRNS